jgi:hypothetical protein
MLKRSLVFAAIVAAAICSANSASAHGHYYYYGGGRGVRPVVVVPYPYQQYGYYGGYYGGVPNVAPPLPQAPGIVMRPSAPAGIARPYHGRLICVQRPSGGIQTVYGDSVYPDDRPCR